MRGELLFQPEVPNQPLCADIPIFNDEALETNEFFLVILVNESVSVDLRQNVTAITILDDDSKCINLHCSYIYLCLLIDTLIYSGNSWATARTV